MVKINFDLKIFLVRVKYIILYYLIFINKKKSHKHKQNIYIVHNNTKYTLNKKFHQNFQFLVTILNWIIFLVNSICLIPWLNNFTTLKILT